MRINVKRVRKLVCNTHMHEVKNELHSSLDSKDLQGSILVQRLAGHLD